MRHRENGSEIGKDLAGLRGFKGVDTRDDLEEGVAVKGRINHQRSIACRRICNHGQTLKHGSPRVGIGLVDGIKIMRILGSQPGQKRDGQTPIIRWLGKQRILRV